MVIQIQYTWIREIKGYADTANVKADNITNIYNGHVHGIVGYAVISKGHNQWSHGPNK